MFSLTHTYVRNRYVDYKNELMIEIFRSHGTDSVDKLIIVLNGVGFQLHVSTLFLVMYENRFSKIYIFMFLKNTFTTKIIYI